MPVSTVRRNTKQTRNDIGYFESLFNTLGPLKYHEINWAGQKYASANSAANSIRAVLNKKNNLNPCRFGTLNLIHESFMLLTHI